MALIYDSWKYLQNFPGGQGKHSLSSCRPLASEGVYVPLGQGCGTIVAADEPMAAKVMMHHVMNKMNESGDWLILVIFRILPVSKL